MGLKILMVILVCGFISTFVPKESRIRFLYGIFYLGLPALIVMGIFLKWVIPFAKSFSPDTQIPLFLAAIICATFTTYLINKSYSFWPGTFFLCRENTAYLVVNQLTSGLRVITQGFNLKFHWEEVDKRNEFDLGVRVGEPYTAKGETVEGGVLVVRGRISWVPNAKSSQSLSTYNSLGGPNDANKKIREALDEAFGSAVLAVMAKYTLFSFKGAAPEIAELISRELKIGTKEISDIENELGIELLRVVIGDISAEKGSHTEKVIALGSKIAVYNASIDMWVAKNPGTTRQEAWSFIALTDPEARAFTVSGSGQLILASDQVLSRGKE